MEKQFFCGETVGDIESNQYYKNYKNNKLFLYFCLQQEQIPTLDVLSLAILFKCDTVNS